MGTVTSELSGTGAGSYYEQYALHPEQWGVSFQVRSFVAMVIQMKNLYYGNFSKIPLFFLN